MVKCNCGYKWQTKSKMILVSCPCCSKKVKIRESFGGDLIKGGVGNAPQEASVSEDTNS